MPNLRVTLWGFNAFMLGVVSYAAAGMTAMLLEKAIAVNTPPAPIMAPAPQNASQQERLPATTFQGVLDTNMFGAERKAVTTAAPAAARPESTQVAPSTLNLTLTGTFVTAGGGFAFASDAAGRNEKVYRVGDCLLTEKLPLPPPCQSGQGTLTAVQQDRITVLYQGQNLAFELKKRLASATTGGARPVPEVRRPAQVEQSPAVETSGGPFPSVRNGNNVELRVPGPEVEKAFENFADVIKQARVIPHSVNGTPEGFRILRIQNQSIFQRLGLANNDIIQRVNGESLGSADQALRLFTLFQNEREIVLDIQRGNEDLTLSYIIE